jgi:hypothetical protein
MCDEDWNKALDGAISHVEGIIMNRVDTPRLRAEMDDMVKVLKGMKIKGITPEMIIRYKSRHGVNCPHCGSNRLDVTTGWDKYIDRSSETAVAAVRRGMACENPDCEEQWTESYELKTIFNGLSPTS